MTGGVDGVVDEVARSVFRRTMVAYVRRLVLGEGP